MPRIVLRRRGWLTLAEVHDQTGLHVSTLLKYVKEERPGYPRLRAKKREGSKAGRGCPWLVSERELARFCEEWGIDPRKAS